MLAVLVTVHDLCENDLPFALAGSIPTEFGQLINLIDLRLYSNKLIGTLPFAPILYTFVLASSLAWPWFDFRAKITLLQLVEKRPNW